MTSRQCSFRNTVIYHVLIFKRALRAHVYSTKPFGKVLILWWVASNKCIYVKHIPQHNNLIPTSLLITLTVFVAGATNSPIYKHRPKLSSVQARANNETVYIWMSFHSSVFPSVPQHPIIPFLHASFSVSLGREAHRRKLFPVMKVTGGTPSGP